MIGTPRGPIIDEGGGVISPPPQPLPVPPPVAPHTASAVAAQPPPQAWPLNPRSGSRLWLRKWTLTIGPRSGQQALDLSLLAFSFEIEKTLGMSAWTARITIYNINDTVLSGLQKQYTNVRLEAGYQPPSQQYGLIFAGPIAYYRYGRLNATDTFVELHAICGDEAFTQAVVNTTLPKGSVAIDVVTACISSMIPFGVSPGFITELSTAKSPRSRALFGMARDILRDVAHTAGANYHVDDDLKLHILKEGESFATEQVPILNSQTGMIDVPTQTMDGGMEVHSLLNFAIRPGRRVHLNNADIVRSQASPTSAAANLPQTFFNLNAQSMGYSASGFYEVGKVRHFGENRGNPWFTYLVTKPAVISPITTPTLVKSA